jgi:quercetin dioxygenase-like cupin family protein
MARSIECPHLQVEIDKYLADGYRLDMITPADAPREVQLSKNGEFVRLISSREPIQTPPGGGVQNGWTQGRAGMMYRDLMPDRMDGLMAVSHIRLTEGGEVPDYVHYHKIEFQMIRCIRGRIKVVYEDQGEPFWLEPGDWVIQPPEIRHRVLECEAGSEVIEVSMPAEHERWVDHEMRLPTATYRPAREFNGQRFIRFIDPK